MLKIIAPSRTRRVFGASVLSVSVLLVGATAWAAQPTDHTKSRITSSDVQVRGMARPSYPKDAADQKIEGTVILIVDVAADGTDSKAVVERAKPAGVFDAAALEAVKKWTFNPEIKGGKAVAGRVRVPMNFRMDDPDVSKNAVSNAPAKVAMVSPPDQWGTYDRMVQSFSATWQPSAPPNGEGC